MVESRSLIIVIALAPTVLFFRVQICMCFEIKEAPADLNCSSICLTHPTVGSNLEWCPTVAYATQTFLAYLFLILKPKSDSIKTADKFKISNLNTNTYKVVRCMNTCYKGGNVNISPTPVSDANFNLRLIATNSSRFLEIYHFRFICMWNLIFVKLDLVFQSSLDLVSDE